MTPLDADQKSELRGALRLMLQKAEAEAAARAALARIRALTSEGATSLDVARYEQTFAHASYVLDAAIDDVVQSIDRATTPEGSTP
jgi:type VI protein secretion system component VasF